MHLSSLLLDEEGRSIKLSSPIVRKHEPLLYLRFQPQQLQSFYLLIKSHVSLPYTVVMQSHTVLQSEHYNQVLCAKQCCFGRSRLCQYGRIRLLQNRLILHQNFSITFHQNGLQYELSTHLCLL